MKKPEFQEVTQKDVLAYIRKHPGSTGEQIRTALGAKPERVSYLLERLRGAEYVKGEGTTRAMKYTAVPGRKLAA